MKSKVIDGKAIAAKIKKEIAAEVAAMIDNDVKAPHLVAVIVGDDAASQTYVTSKENACRSVGITSSVYRLESAATEKELLEMVQFLNHDPDVDGFIVQLPLPDHIDTDKIIQAIDPKKDVDGFHPENAGRMMLGLPSYHAATPFGIMELLRRSKIEVTGKHVVVLGRSNIVGTPLSVMLSRKAAGADATVTLCHSRTANLKAITLQADILVAAIGKCGFVTADMVKPGAVVVDVGIHRVEDASKEKGYHLAGDVDYKQVFEKVAHITPVPGGVGPMTIVSLLQNTLAAAKHSIYQE
ncbi:MAG: bifunctional methylenetetrahydrofolate dehydrogenase/methenyltetrahydrofolate cyclohydrolase FolD [Bacteroidetes bacterium]|nr:bifunctional methylenetetrahydrofolate dehydrogenase/methenyltetrahydrofolate cyclohydrolase FolD [Bacteroidota bacterium]MBU1579864.1 bifunctional methylenetetrahydrofolate dehydrogenase/methenyltetrahydrofolate cyclohydrolase FolD [Bacteroidota bacterium]MBU2556907.1 bifunctional methylenetetrahydrofolate dehydrogenase/methenyltetrahydrofolate cyclohydrolase FolD [Bacteroidota bacterium]